jgi:hypothetical protein
LAPARFAAAIFILELPTPLVIVQDIYGDTVVGRRFRPVKEGEQSAVLVKGFSLYYGGVPDLHADLVSGLQFIDTFKGHAHPSTPVKLPMLHLPRFSRAVMDIDDSPGRRLGTTPSFPGHAVTLERALGVLAVPDAGRRLGCDALSSLRDSSVLMLSDPMPDGLASFPSAGSTQMRSPPGQFPMGGRGSPVTGENGPSLASGTTGAGSLAGRDWVSSAVSLGSSSSWRGVIGVSFLDYAEPRLVVCRYPHQSRKPSGTH